MKKVLPLLGWLLVVATVMGVVLAGVYLILLVVAWMFLKPIGVVLGLLALGLC